LKKTVVVQDCPRKYLSPYFYLWDGVQDCPRKYLSPYFYLWEGVQDCPRKYNTGRGPYMMVFVIT